MGIAMRTVWVTSGRGASPEAFARADADESGLRYAAHTVRVDVDVYVFECIVLVNGAIAFSV